MAKPYIVVVEDDHLQEGPVLEHLEEAFPEGRVESIGSEREFRERLPSFREDRPDVAVMDVMLRWSHPSPDAEPPPPDVSEGGFPRAGLRCADLLADDRVLAKTPVIFYTILERSDLEQDGLRLREQNVYVRKSADLDVLTRKIKEVTRSSMR